MHRINDLCKIFNTSNYIKFSKIMNMKIPNKYLPINPYKPLNKALIFKGIENQFYKIGLSEFNVNKIEKRKIYFNPILAMSNLLLQGIRIYITLFICSNNDIKCLIQTGDFPYFLNLRIHFNLFNIVALTVILLSQTTQFLYYIQRIYPSYLKIIKLFSGDITPYLLDLENPSDIYKLYRMVKFLVLLEFNTKTLAILAFIINFSTLALNCTIVEIFFYAIP
jgi:hypothetical protein